MWVKTTDTILFFYHCEYLLLTYIYNIYIYNQSLSCRHSCSVFSATVTCCLMLPRKKSNYLTSLQLPRQILVRALCSVLVDTLIWAVKQQPTVYRCTPCGRLGNILHSSSINRRISFILPCLFFADNVLCIAIYSIVNDVETPNGHAEGFITLPLTFLPGVPLTPDQMCLSPFF